MKVKKTVHVDRVSVTYNEINGSGPVAILVHGAGANRNYWKTLCDVMSERHLLCPDLYGHGETPPWVSVPRENPSYSYLDDVPLLEGIVQQQSPPFDLVGHSSGGSVCLEFARKHPGRVRRLVLIEPMLPSILKDLDPGAWSEVSSAYEKSHQLAKMGQLEDAARILFEYILGDGQWALLPVKIRNWMAQNVKTTLNAHSAASLNLTTHHAEYSTLKIPTLIIHGDRTRHPYRRIAQCLSQLLKYSQLHVIADASHNSPLTHSEKVNGLILTFLNAA